MYYVLKICSIEKLYHFFAVEVFGMKPIFNNVSKVELQSTKLHNNQGRRNWGGQEGQPPLLSFTRRGKGGIGALSI
jgi:hypothetical protein